MIGFILEKFKKWRRGTGFLAQDDPPAVQDQTDQDDQDDQDELLENPSTTIVLNLREDGEFTVALDFMRTEDEVAEVTGTMLHMINSGLMAEYFVEALNLWSEDKEQKKFILTIVKRWRSLYEEANAEDETVLAPSKLAVDPTDVFGLRRLQQQESK